MNFNQAVKKIIKMIPVGETRLMVAERDSSGGYDIHVQQVWVNKDGSFVWRYASGCSCWSGEWDEDHIATIKEFIVECDEDWQKAVIAFAETGEVQDLA